MFCHRDSTFLCSLSTLLQKNPLQTAPRATDIRDLSIGKAELNKKIILAVSLTLLISAAAIVIFFHRPQVLPDFEVHVLGIECIAALRNKTYRYHVHLTIRNNGTAKATEIEGYVQFWTHTPVSAGLILLPQEENEIVANEEVNCVIHLVSPDTQEVKYLIIEVSCAEGVAKEFNMTKP